MRAVWAGMMAAPLALFVWFGVPGSGDDTVSVTGSVTFSGDIPPGTPIDMAADEYCVGVQTETPMARAVVVGAGGRLADVLVYVKEGVGDDYPDPDVEVVLAQSGCRYTPRVVALQTGQTLGILNDDDTFHNVHAFAKVNRGFNIGQPIKGMKARRSFDDSEIGISVKCDVHGWMQSYLHVLDNPFFAVTGEDGTFDLGALPPGEYVIEAWHPTLGARTQTVQAVAGQSISLELRFD